MNSSTDVPRTWLHVDRLRALIGVLLVGASAACASQQAVVAGAPSQHTSSDQGPVTTTYPVDIEPPLAGEWDPEGEWFGGQDTVQYKPIQLPNFLEPGEIIALRSPFESRAPGSWTGLSFSCQSRFMCVAHGLARALAAHYRGNGGRGDHCDVEPGGENAASIYCDYHQLEELIDEGGRVWEHHQLTVHLRLDDEDGLTSTLQLRALYADGYLAPNRVADYRFDFERDRHGDFTRYLTVIKNWVQATLRALVDKHIGGVG